METEEMNLGGENSVVLDEDNGLNQQDVRGQDSIEIKKTEKKNNKLSRDLMDMMRTFHNDNPYNPKPYLLELLESKGKN